MELSDYRESEQGRCERHSCTPLSRNAPWPSMPLGYPAISEGLCTVINKCESYTPSLLQNPGFSELYHSRNILKKSVRHTSCFSEQCKLSAHVWDPSSSSVQCFSSDHSLDFTTLCYWGLIQLCHVQPSQLSHQLSIFMQTANNSSFHLQHSTAKSYFTLIF